MRRVCALFTAIALLLGLCACKKTDPWQEQYDLGVRYLSEGNYQEAILAFEAAIEIDSQRSEAYVELANVYLAMDDPARAAEVLERGYVATGEASLQEWLAALTTPRPEPTLGPPPEPTLGPPPEPAPEPTPEPTPGPTPGPAELVFTDSGSCGEGTLWGYDENAGVLVIEGSGDMTNFTFVDGTDLPRPWEGYKDSIVEVIVRDGVTSIGWNAFEEFSNLERVTIADSVTDVGWYAFRNCASLTSVVLPDSVVGIGWVAFGGCTSLNSVAMSAGLLEIGWSAFNECVSLSEVTIPEGVATIGDGAFGGCTGLGSVTIPGSVTTIGGGHFRSAPA